MGKLLKYLKGYTVYSVLAPLFKLFEALLELTVPLVVSRIVDVGITEGRETGDFSGIVMSCLLLLGIGLAGFAFALTAQYFSAYAATGFGAGLRSSLFAKIQSLGFSQLDREGTATLITRMTGDVNQVQTGVNLTLRLLLRSPFVVFGALIMALIYGRNAPLATLAFVIVIPLLAIIIFAILLSGIPAQKRAQKKLDGITGAQRANLEGARVIRAFGLEDAENTTFSKKSRILSKFQLAAGRISGLLNPLTFAVVNGAVIMLLANGAIAVDKGSISAGMLIALYNYMTQILVELIKLANLIITMTKSVACAGRISDIMNTESDMSVITDNNTENRDDAPAVEFDGVSFAYPGSSGTVLENIGFKVARGERVGIIGGTGSGKSTLVGLIPRFYDAVSGCVKVFGRDVRSYQTEDLRGHIGYVSQKATLFSGTVRDNIKWGKTDASDTEIEQALKSAQFTSVLTEKENGLSSQVDEGGKNFSGGQRQRLCIARALVRRPDILVFDDSSSALDRATEAEFRRAVESLDYSPAVIMVSQRVESVENCDKIIVLDNGLIVGIGTHTKLYESCPVYREICSSQTGGQTE